MVTGEQAKQIDDEIEKLLAICSEAKKIGLEEVKRRHYET